MDKDKFLEKIKEIGTCEDMAQVRTMLTELSDDVTKVYDEVASNKATIETLNDSIKKKDEDNEKLREYNMEMFKRLPVDKTEAEVKANSTGIKEEQPKEYKSYDEIAKNF